MEGLSTIKITGHGGKAFTSTEILKRKRDSLQYIYTLRSAFQSEISIDFGQLMEDYDFSKIMHQFHDGNVTLIRKKLT